MNAEQLKEALVHFSTRRLGLNPFDHVLVVGKPMQQFSLDVQETCATALVYIDDLEVIAQAFKEERPAGPSFYALLSECRAQKDLVKALQARNARQAAMLDKLEQDLAHAKKVKES